MFCSLYIVYCINILYMFDLANIRQGNTVGNIT